MLLPGVSVVNAERLMDGSDTRRTLMLKSKRSLMNSDTVPLLTREPSDLPNTFSRESKRRSLLVVVSSSLIICFVDIRVMLDAIVPRAYDYVYCRVSSFRLICLYVHADS